MYSHEKICTIIDKNDDEIILNALTSGDDVLSLLSRQNDLKVREAIINYVIQSEKYYFHIPEFVDYAVHDNQVDQLFQIVTRPKNFSSWIKIVKRNGEENILFVSCFRTLEHKKVIFDLIESTNSIQILGDDLHNWMNYFFKGDHRLDKDEVERFFQWLVSFGLFHSTHFAPSDFARLASYLLRFEDDYKIKLEDLSQNIFGMDNFKTIMMNIFSPLYKCDELRKGTHPESDQRQRSIRPSLYLMKKVFRPWTEKIKLFKQLHKPEYSVLLSKKDGSQQLIPCFFIEDYNGWHQFYDVYWESNEKTKLQEYKECIDFTCFNRICHNSLVCSSSSDNTQSIKDNAIDEKIDPFDDFKKQLTENPSQPSSFYATIKTLSEEQLVDLMGLLVKPNIFPFFIKTREGIELLLSVGMFKMDKYLDELLKPHIFPKFCISWYNLGFWRNNDLITTLCSLCVTYKKMDKLLPLLYANARLLLLDLRELNLLKEYFPDNEAFSVPNLKSAYERIDLAHEKTLLTYKVNAIKSLFFFCDDTVMQIANLLEVKDGKNMALTCHKALNSANNAWKINSQHECSPASEDDEQTDVPHFVVKK